MLVFVNARQLEPIIERAISDFCQFVPENLRLDSKFLGRSQDCWEVMAEFDIDGAHHNVRVVIDPISGRVQEIGFIKGIT